MTRNALTVGIVAGMFLIAPSVLAQGRGGGGRGGGGRGGGAAPAAEAEPGIPVTDALTISKCASCHMKDEKGNLSRISWIRTTPEGWEEAIKRMIRLNGLILQPAEAKLIVKYLSNAHGLPPEEAKPVMYMTEHRIQDEVIPNDSVKSTCNNCHALGRAFQWHRTRGEWSLLADTHSALYQQAESAFRRNGGNRNGGGAAATANTGGRNGVVVAVLPQPQTTHRLPPRRYRWTRRWTSWARVTDSILRNGRLGERVCARRR